VLKDRPDRKFSARYWQNGALRRKAAYLRLLAQGWCGTCAWLLQNNALHRSIVDCDENVAGQESEQNRFFVCGPSSAIMAEARRIVLSRETNVRASVLCAAANPSGSVWTFAQGCACQNQPLTYFRLKIKLLVNLLLNLNKPFRRLSQQRREHIGAFIVLTTN
jgi:hypothetical protein